MNLIFQQSALKLPSIFQHNHTFCTLQYNAKVFGRKGWPAVAVYPRIKKALATKSAKAVAALPAFPHSLQDWIHSSAQQLGLAPRTFVEGKIIQTSLHSLTGFKSL